MEGARGSLGADRDRHCWLLWGGMSLSPKDKSTHHLFWESALGMARATALLGSRQGRGGDGNYPWSVPPPEHRAGMVSGSGLTLAPAGERGRSRAAGQNLQRSRAGTAAQPGRGVAPARGPQQSKVPIPSPTGGVWARPLPCWSCAGTDSIGQGQLPETRQGQGRDTPLQLNRHPVTPSWSCWGWGGGQRAPC